MGTCLYHYNISTGLDAAVCSIARHKKCPQAMLRTELAVPKI
nr:MAG TPA: hypothetical protein [Caudoviricetes sp.]